MQTLHVHAQQHNQVENGGYGSSTSQRCRQSFEWNVTVITLQGTVRGKRFSHRDQSSINQTHKFTQYRNHMGIINPTCTHRTNKAFAAVTIAARPLPLTKCKVVFPSRVKQQTPTKDTTKDKRVCEIVVIGSHNIKCMVHGKHKPSVASEEPIELLVSVQLANHRRH